MITRIIIVSGAILLITGMIALYGSSKYDEGYAKAVADNTEAMGAAQKESAVIRERAKHAVQNMEDSRLDDVAASLGILRPDSVR